MLSLRLNERLDWENSKPEPLSMTSGSSYPLSLLVSHVSAVSFVTLSVFRTAPVVEDPHVIVAGLFGQRGD